MFTLFTIERPVTPVGDDDVRNTIEMLRRQRARYEHVIRPAAASDRVIVDFSGRIDGVAFPGGQASDFAIVIGESRMLPEFEAAVRSGEVAHHAALPPQKPFVHHAEQVGRRRRRVHRPTHSRAVVCENAQRPSSWRRRG